MHSATYDNYSGCIILTEVADWGRQFSKKEKLVKPDVSLKRQSVLILNSNWSKKIPLMLTQFINSINEDFLVVLCRIPHQTDLSPPKKSRRGREGD